MTSENHHNDEQQLSASWPTEAEVRDIRSAFTRRMAPTPDVEEAWRLMASSISSIDEEPRRFYLPSYWKAIGAAVAAACLLLLFYLPTRQASEKDLPEVTAKAEMGEEQDVTMTVKRGSWEGVKNKKGEKRVVTAKNISFGQKANDDTSMPTYILMTTPCGKDCHLTLSDGTRVWMNADSHLEFPECFSGSTRRVRLHGEAYFEVAKDSQHPFVVESEYLTTTVLGTSFNMCAYSAKEASVALVEGRVAVKSGNQTATLMPNEQLTLRNGTLKKERVDTYGFTQRKEGYFYFNHDTMREIMVELGRWYKKTIVFEDADVMDMRLHFVAERSQTLPQIINSLCEMDGVDIELGNEEIVVK